MLIRKKREWFGFIGCLLVIGIVGMAANEFNLSYIISAVAIGYISLEAIKAISTYDITKCNYKYTSIVIYICGAFGGIIFGGIAYYIIRNTENIK